MTFSTALHNCNRPHEPIIFTSNIISQVDACDGSYLTKSLTGKPTVGILNITVGILSLQHTP